MSFAEVEIVTNPEAIYAEGLAKLKELLEAKGIVGWQPNEADLGIIELQTHASMVPTVAQIAAVVPPAIFRRYGTELVQTPYNEGAAATVTSKWTLLEEGSEFPPRTIEAGTQLTIGTFAFYVQGDVSVLKGESTALVALVASERGAEFNGLEGVVELVDAITWVQAVALVGITSGGVDQESDEEYQNRLAAALKLQAPRPITAANFAEMALDVPSSIVPSGVVVGRSTAIDGYSPEVNTFKGKIKTGSKEVTAVTSFTGVTVKTELSGSGIPTADLVQSVNEGAKTLQLTVAATKEEEITFTATGSFENQRTVTTFVTDRKGVALSAEAMEALETWLRAFREINFVVFCRAPSTTTVYVTTKIHVEPGYATASIEASVKQALESYLSPETWGNPTGQTTGANSWLNIVQGYSLVRYNTIVGVIEAVPGVQYVFSGSAGLKTGLTAAPAGTVDITLPGPAPLAHSTSVSIVVSSE